MAVRRPRPQDRRDRCRRLTHLQGQCSYTCVEENGEQEAGTERVHGRAPPQAPGPSRK